MADRIRIEFPQGSHLDAIEARVSRVPVVDEYIEIDHDAVAWRVVSVAHLLNRPSTAVQAIVRVR